jgi:lysophospholipase L1-like esterase
VSALQLHIVRHAHATNSTVYVVGDSLTLLAEPEMTADFIKAGWSSSAISADQGRGVDFKIGADTDTGLTAVDALRAGSGDGDGWVVTLGTNEVLYAPPSTYLAVIRQMMDRIGRSRRVMWVDVYLPDHQVDAATWNTALDQVAAERKGDLVVFGWAALNAQHPEWMLYDNIHHNAAGNAAWASAIGEASRAILLPAQPTNDPAPTLKADGAPSGFVAVGPRRILDTRIDGRGGAVAARSITRLDLAPLVPNDTTAVAINITAIGYTRSGYATAYPCAKGVPRTSTVNFTRAGGPPQSASTIVGVDDDEQLCVFSNSAMDIVVDLSGAFVAHQGLPMAATAPARIADTRATLLPVLFAGSVIRVAAPTSSGAVIVNLTVDRVGADGYLTAWPCAQDRPNVSNLNYAVSERQQANVAVVAIGPDQALCVFNSAPTAVIVDLLAVFAPGLADLFQPASPTRVLDTRSGAGGWSGRTTPGQVLTVGPLGLADGAVAVGSVTVTNAVAAGYLTSWSGSGPPPDTSEVNFVHGVTRPNMVIVGTASDGMFRLMQSGAGRADVVVDITGWFAP